MTWLELQQEMSIAGRPSEITRLGHKIESLLFVTIDATNRAELTNVELMLNRLVAEIKLMQRRYDRINRLTDES